MKNIKESKVIDNFKKFMKSNFKKISFHKIHVTPVHNRGFPDLLIVFEGVTLFVEVKAPGKKPTDNQLLTLQKLHKAGAKVFVMDCSPDNKDCLIFYDVNLEVVGTILIKRKDAKSTFLRLVNS